MGNGTRLEDMHDKWMMDPDYRREYEAIEAYERSAILLVNKHASQLVRLPKDKYK